MSGEAIEIDADSATSPYYISYPLYENRIMGQIDE